MTAYFILQGIKTDLDQESMLSVPDHSGILRLNTWKWQETSVEGSGGFSRVS